MRCLPVLSLILAGCSRKPTQLYAQAHLSARTQVPTTPLNASSNSVTQLVNGTQGVRVNSSPKPPLEGTRWHAAHERHPAETHGNVRRVQVQVPLLAQQNPRES